MGGGLISAYEGVGEGVYMRWEVDELGDELFMRFEVGDEESLVRNEVGGDW